MFYSKNAWKKTLPIIVREVPPTKDHESCNAIHVTHESNGRVSPVMVESKLSERAICSICLFEKSSADFSKRQFKIFQRSNSGTCKACVYAIQDHENIAFEDKHWQLRHVPPPKMEGAVWETKDTTPTVEPKPPDASSRSTHPSLPDHDVCSICFSHFDKGVECKTVCGHRFHRNCIDEYIAHKVQREKELTCPNCRYIL